MNYLLIIAAVLVISLGVYLILRFVKKAAKIVFILSLIIFVVSSVLGISLLQEVQQFKEEWTTKEKLLLLRDEQIIAGFHGRLIQEEQPGIATQREIQQFNQYFQENNLEPLLEDYYKILVFDLSLFENLTTIPFDKKNYSREFIFSLIKDKQPLEKFSIRQIEEQDAEPTPELITFASNNIKDQLDINSSQEFKAVLFMLLYTEASSDDRLFLIKNLGRGIQIYDETLIFKIIKILPLSIVENFIIDRG